MSFIAHKRKCDKLEQSVAKHLKEASEEAQKCATKLGNDKAGGLIGLLHDLGKYSHDFQDYIQSAHGMINPDEDRYVYAKGMKGKIDHSTAGAQWVCQILNTEAKARFTDPTQFKLVNAGIQALALCIASHHSGLIDCLPSNYGKGFLKRVQKPEEKTHFKECMQRADAKILNTAQAIVEDGLLEQILATLQNIVAPQQNGFAVSQLSQDFYLGMYTKFLFSCLIDADRISSADFETPGNKLHRSDNPPDWLQACQRVEQFVGELEIRNPIDHTRRQISNDCKAKAALKQGIKSLTVPTGGGKTYTSIRYAVHHAKKHKLDRIIYIIPFTSIIDQNAAELRKVIERDGDESPWVLEQHSNLEPEKQTWRSKLVAENWDAPIVLTTMVQFLETLFDGGTRGVRKLHQLANSVIVFDEIQTLPVNCVHLFCNSINFLAAHCNTTAIMCTATQPLLNKLKHTEKGQLHLRDEDELIPNVSKLFDDLERVDIVDKTKPGSGWTLAEISDLAIQQLRGKGSCLAIVNTKDWARQLYQACAKHADSSQIFHLSTSQYPAHRKVLLDEIRARLDNDLPTLCISTQLIEAGVDVDFASVIRFMAGMDSIAQAAGRCNRNGHGKKAQVLVVNPDNESIDTLVDIKVGIEKTEQVLRQFSGEHMLMPKVMNQYFQYFFFDRAEQMHYPVNDKKTNVNDNLLNLLSQNKIDPCGHYPLGLKQSFMTAGKAFKAIDAPTQSLIVEHGEGKHLLTALCATSKAFEAKAYYDLLKKLQQYSINVFPNIWRKLQVQDAICELQNEKGEGEGIYYLKERYYSDDFGAMTEPVTVMTSYVC